MTILRNGEKDELYRVISPFCTESNNYIRFKSRSWHGTGTTMRQRLNRLIGSPTTMHTYINRQSWRPNTTTKMNDNICLNCTITWPVVSTSSRSFPRSSCITGFVTRLTRRVSLVEQELLTLPEHLSSPPVFSGVRVTRSLVLYVCFVDRCLSFCTFSFGHCVVCSSSIYGIWLPFW